MNGSDSYYLNSIKKQYDYGILRLDVLMDIIFQDSINTNTKIRQSIKRKGLDKTLSILENRPAYFGKLRGKAFLGMECQDRADAKALIPEFRRALKWNHLVTIEYSRAKEIIKVRSATHSESKEQSR